MLIFYFAFLISTLRSAMGTEYPTLPSRPTRGIVETGHGGPNYKFRPPTYNPNVRTIQSDSPKSLSYYKDGKVLSGSGAGSTFDNVFKQPSPLGREQSSPYFDKLFTMSAGYKVANNGKPLKPIFDGKSLRSQNVALGPHGLTSSPNIQVPVYKTSYSIPKISESQGFAHSIQGSPFGDIVNGRKASLPIVEVQRKEQLPAYLSSFGNQQLVLNPDSHQFNFAGRAPKVNNVQLSAPFLSPHSSFQGQVVPISAASNPQFPQYKGASIEIYPTVGGFSTTGYQPLQTQPQLHFGHANVQPVGGIRHTVPAEEIRSDVELINKKKPTTPPPKEDDDGGYEDDEGYSSAEKEYGQTSHDDDDYESKSKPGKYFAAPQTEGDFKPSTSFPFKQYDKKFGRHSNREEDGDERPYSKYYNYSSDNDDDDDDDSSSKYRSEDSSSKPYYRKHDHDDEEEEDNDKGYEKQRTEETYDSSYKPKYFDKNIEEDFETSYSKELPKQRNTHAKEVPEAEYGTKSSRRNKSNYESDDSSSQGSKASFRYYKTPKTFKDNKGDSSEVSLRTLPEAYDGNFGYKTLDRIKNHRQMRRTSP